MVNTNPPRRAANCRASICPIDKGLKLQATSSKLQAARKNYVNYVIIWTRTLARARSCELRVHLVRVSSSKRATICRATLCHIDKSSKQQASSPKQQASSFKPEAASSLIREPRYMDIGKVFDARGPRASAMMKVLCGCFTWNAIWCGENLSFLPFVTFNSTVKKWPEVL